LRHMKVPRLGVSSELQLLATATAAPDPSHVCDLHHSSRQRQILNPLSEARNRTYNLMVPSRIHFCRAMTGTPTLTLLLFFLFVVSDFFSLMLFFFFNFFIFPLYSKGIRLSLHVYITITFFPPPFVLLQHEYLDSSQCYSVGSPCKSILSCV